MTCETETVTAFVCDECLAKTEAILARVRPVFEAMLACGVPRDVANETMTFMLESYYP